MNIYQTTFASGLPMAVRAANVAEARTKFESFAELGEVMGKDSVIALQYATV